MNRQLLLIVIGVFCLIAVEKSKACPQGEESQAKNRPNVLFVSVDDLRPELGCYGNPVIQTPSFDAFAKTGTTFMKSILPSCGVCAVSCQCDDGIATGLDPRLGLAW